MSSRKHLPQARASAAADSERQGLIASAGRSLAGRTRDLLLNHGLRPRKSLGQNFLISEPKVERIAAAATAAAAALAPLGEGAGRIVEVGPGLGALTVALAARGNHIVAYEVDRDLPGPLTEVLAPFDKVTVHCADFLTVDLEQATAGKPFVLAGNLPYQITTPLLEKLFAAPLCRALVITIQREVAQRLRAQPGTRDYSPLTLFCQWHVERLETICELSPGDFFPPPEVSSTALRLDKRSLPPVAHPPAAAFFGVVRAAFNQRRKSLRAALGGSKLLGVDRATVETALEAAELDGGRRAETLSLEEFARLAAQLEPYR